MTSLNFNSFDITVWGSGLPSHIKEDDVKANTLLAHLRMAQDAPAPTFFAELSACHTTRNLYTAIYLHQLAHTHPGNYFNPAEYIISEVVVFKDRFLIQHEGFVFHVRHQPPAPHQAEPDFFIKIDRNIESTGLGSLISSQKFALDRVNCSLHPGVMHETFGRPIVWRMPAPAPVGNNYTFNLNLYQVGVLLEAVSVSYPQPQYNALHNNCFSHSRILRTVIIRLIQAQQLAGNNVLVTADEPNILWMALGTCFGIPLDTNEGEEDMVFATYGTLYPRFL